MSRSYCTFTDPPISLVPFVIRTLCPHQPLKPPRSINFMLQRRTHTGEPWAPALNVTRFVPRIDVGELVGRELPGASDAVAELLRSGTRLFHWDGRMQADLLL